MAHAAAQPRLVDPVRLAKKGISLRGLSGNAQFAILLALHCAVVSNLAVRLATARLGTQIICWTCRADQQLNNFGVWQDLASVSATGMPIRLPGAGVPAQP